MRRKQDKAEALLREGERRVVWLVALHAALSRPTGRDALITADRALDHYEKKFPPLKNEGALTAALVLATKPVSVIRFTDTQGVETYEYC